MREWKTVLQVSQSSAFLLVTSEGEDLLKAKLSASPSHPRALLTLLEGLALWHGEALDVVVSAGVSCADWAMPALFGDELFPAESQLVRYHIGTRSAERIVTRRRGHDEIEDGWAGWKGFSAQSWGAEACG
jgi:hypothetical protein